MPAALRSALAAAVLILLVAGPAPAAAGSGRIYQFNGPPGCTTLTGAEDCRSGRALRGASAAAVSPDGRQLYVASNESGSVTTFLRDRRTGKLVQPRGQRGCVSESGAGNCVAGRGLHGAFSVAVSPDGRNVYVASLREVAVFARDAETGQLTQLDGAQGCVSQDAALGCTPARALETTASVVVSPDGLNVYVTGYQSGSVSVFARDPGTGALDQLPFQAGCISAYGVEGCAIGRGMAGAFSVVVGPSGMRVFVSGYVSDAIAVFARDPSTGALQQLPGTAGCASREGLEGCTVARAVGGPNGIALSPDARSLYVASSGADAIAVFAVQPDGSLVQVPGKRGCARLGGGEGCARSGSLYGAFAVAVSSDARNIYVASLEAVTAYRRKPDGFLVARGCTSDGGGSGCRTGRALEGGTSVAVDPRDRHVYVTADRSDAVSSFVRDPGRGRVRVRLRGIGDGCVRRPFRVRARVASLLPLRRVRISLDERTVAFSDQQRLALRVRPAKLPRGRHRLSVKAVDVTGSAGRRHAMLERC